jgi:threonine dehydrogenase-like Zn-dependent dehydrogenase
MGADMTVNVRQESLAWLMGKADVVVEASGNASFFGQACELLRRGGRLALVGLFRSEPPLLDLNQLVTRNLAVVGSLGSPGVWERTIALLAAGRLDPLPIITHRFPLDQVAQAFGVVADRATGAVKAMVMP